MSGTADSLDPGAPLGRMPHRGPTQICIGTAVSRRLAMSWAEAAAILGSGRWSIAS